MLCTWWSRTSLGILKNYWELLRRWSGRRLEEETDEDDEQRLEDARLH